MKYRIIKIFICFISIFVSTRLFAQLDYVSITSSGESKTKAGAEVIAVRNAVEKAYNKYELISPDVFNRIKKTPDAGSLKSSNAIYWGDIKCYDVLSATENNNLWTVFVRVAVSFDRLVSWANYSWPAMVEELEEYSQIHFSYDGKYAKVSTKDGKLGLLSTTTGNEILPAEFTEIWPLEYSNDMIDDDESENTYFTDYDPYVFAVKDGMKGVYDKYGECICENYISISGRDVLFATVDGGMDIINPQTKVHIHVNCEDNNPAGHYCSIKRNGKWGVVNKDGKIIIDTIYDEIPNQTDGEIYYLGSEGADIVVVKNGKYGIINMKGDVMLPFEYDYINPMCGKYKPLSLNGKWGLYFEGKVIKPCTFTSEFEVEEFISWDEDDED